MCNVGFLYLYRIESNAQNSKKIVCDHWNFLNTSLFLYFVRKFLSSSKSYEVSFFLSAFSCSLMNDFMPPSVNLLLHRSPLFKQRLATCNGTKCHHRYPHRCGYGNFVPDVVLYEFYKCIFQYITGVYIIMTNKVGRSPELVYCPHLLSTP